MCRADYVRSTLVAPRRVVPGRRSALESQAGVRGDRGSPPRCGIY